MGDMVRETIDVLREIQEKIKTAYDELDKSHSIQRIFPDAFEHGSCKATWVDATRRGTVGRPGQESVNYKVTRGDGSVREIHFEDLPEWFVDDLIVEGGIKGYPRALHRGPKNRLTKLLSSIVRKRKDKAYNESPRSHRHGFQ